MKPEDFIYTDFNGTKYDMNFSFVRPWWKDADDYQPILEWSSVKIAWEFLRRNPQYFQEFRSWKCSHSHALQERVDDDHPLWQLANNKLRDLRAHFGLDPNFGPSSPSSPDLCPLFANQRSLAKSDNVVLFGTSKDKDVLVATMEAYRGVVYVISRGKGWPRKKTLSPEARVHRRKEFVIYLRLIDAKSEGARPRDIFTWIECYHGKPRDIAQKALDNHWRAAKRMMTSGYQGLAANI